MFKRFFAHPHATKLAVAGLIGLLLLVASGIGGSIVSANTTTIAIANLGHSPTGTANLYYSPEDQTLTVTVSLIGFAPKSTHPAHIHLGSCTNPNPGTVKYPLHNVVADAMGQGSATTIIHNVSGGIPATGFYINVHNGPNLKPAVQYTPISCGTILNPNRDRSVTVFMGPSPGLDENATGFARLSLIAGKLTVMVNVHGLTPKSAHMMHIHAGNCFYTKQVLYGLSSLTADANGNASKIVVIDNVDSIPAQGWDINIHYSTDLSTQTGYNPILCGNVVLMSDTTPPSAMS